MFDGLGSHGMNITILHHHLGQYVWNIFLSASSGCKSKVRLRDGPEALGNDSICRSHLPKDAQLKTNFRPENAKVGKCGPKRCSQMAKNYLKQNQSKLVGGSKPFEQYQSNWIISPSRGENKKCLKPPPSKIRWDRFRVYIRYSQKKREISPAKRPPFLKSPLRYNSKIFFRQRGASAPGRIWRFCRFGWWLLNEFVWEVCDPLGVEMGYLICIMFEPCNYAQLTEGRPLSCIFTAGQKSLYGDWSFHQVGFVKPSPTIEIGGSLDPSTHWTVNFKPYHPCNYSVCSM